ncbi:MAG: aminotransferase [Proteobacteria bacterium]|nr:aminotransferase [Pseudomonadota bacterium]
MPTNDIPQAPRSAYAERDRAHVLHPTTDLAAHRQSGPLIIERGEGIHVFDENGRRYIEGMAGLWCTSLGFSRPELMQAALAQMQALPFYHSFGNMGTKPTIDLAERLIRMAPFKASKVFFANSGSEANDTQAKLIRYYNNAIGKPHKKKIISRQRAYHGVTWLTAGLTGLPAFRNGFDVDHPDILHTDCPHFYKYGLTGETEAEYVDRLAANLDALIQRENPDRIAAFIAEPVMGGAGVLPPPAGYFEKIQQVLKRYDIRFIADEVICGFGRTGRMFGCETYAIQPDSMTLAKQISSGYLPISAVLIGEDMYDVLVSESGKKGVFGHGYTYGGHPVSAAVALRTIELYEELDILAHVQKVAVRFQQRLHGLKDHPLVGETRGVGLIGGVEMVADKAAKRAFAPAAGVGKTAWANSLKHGLINRASGDAIVLAPPLVISESEIDDLFDCLERALDDTESHVTKEGLRS